MNPKRYLLIPVLMALLWLLAVWTPGLRHSSAAEQAVVGQGSQLLTPGAPNPIESPTTPTATPTTTATTTGPPRPRRQPPRGQSPQPRRQPLRGQPPLRQRLPLRGRSPQRQRQPPRGLPPRPRRQRRPEQSWRRQLHRIFTFLLSVRKGCGDGWMMAPSRPAR